ncbi:coenzyme F420 hydrogenase/dehydrogenase beta subunit N-terminal domain-containing protein, partial [Thermodesulfobacteriota bacterium]
MEQFKDHLERSKQGFAALEPVIEYCCSRCGLCASLCPEKAIVMEETIPRLAGNCNNCGLCYQGCPRSFFPEKKVKQRWYGTERNYLKKRIGNCVDRFTSRSLNYEIFEGGTNGGTTTALLHYLLENNFVDAVLHLDSIHKQSFICHHAKTIVSTTPEETLRGQHSKQHITPILHDLKKLSGYQRTAVVGLSCHVEGLRKLQIIKDDPDLRQLFTALAKRAEKLIGNIEFVIGLNCFMNLKHGAIDKIYR